MPSERKYPPAIDQQRISTDPHPQAKICSNCHSPVDPTSSVFLPEADAIICNGCRVSARSSSSSPDGHAMCLDVDPSFDHNLSAHEDRSPLQNTRHISDEHIFVDEDTDIISPASQASLSVSENAYHVSLITPPTYTRKHSPTLSCNTSSSFHHVSIAALSTQPTNTVKRPESSSASLDPLIDITRLRVRSRGHHCLYPGASFQGTQKSGRNSYDVNVTIVDVDFSSSFLCGYLRIRGLTDDWPELTTYFDAEIIGSRYGFLTQNWGANEHEDMVHWSRFPAFRHVKSELRQPHLTMSDRDRGAVFMRWKERFLVPDHRVLDINGASFAGFYYVCVDFNPPPPPTPTKPCIPMTANDDGFISPLPLPHVLADTLVPPKTASVAPGMRTESSQQEVRSQSHASRVTPPSATMSGFYFHQNSEPYQQLSLCHVPERTSSSFEFR